MSIELDLSKLYGFKIVAAQNASLATAATGSRIGEKAGLKPAPVLAGAMGSKLGNKTGQKP